MEKSKKWLILTIVGVVSLLGGIVCLIVALLQPEPEVLGLTFPQIPSTSTDTSTYSDLTGLKISADQKTAPTYCIQTPNGMDGARPQAGLDQAGVVFEAIAEAGITRFAAIYQAPTSAVIGPIRSLRLYYLQWDTPFDCTIVHAGGADDALAAVRNGGYKDLTENYTYMYRGSAGNRLWNNLFTTSTLLSTMNTDRGYGGSEVHGFTRMTPKESKQDLVDQNIATKLSIVEAADSDTSTLTPKVTDISVHFGGIASFNVNYKYDLTTNSYLRSYQNGMAHEIYTCPDSNLGEVNPESACTLKQLSPTVVVAMVVSEKKAWDNYHEDITTLGSGEAYVFQNGYAIKGRWEKNTVADQIKFYDESGVEIALAPGQTFVEAVPNYGSIDF
ncbi:DUF3048 domain-containing protein [Candidatus Saccharibacteria bacterium]|nr:DUF3048 domain-containing protein [Candidatus Saccharibacteria bacterium]